MGLDGNILHDAAVDVGEAEVAAAVAAGEAGVVEAHLVQDGGVQVVDVDAVFHGHKAKVIGRAVGQAAAEAVHVASARGCRFAAQVKRFLGGARAGRLHYAANTVRRENAGQAPRLNSCVAVSDERSGHRVSADS